MFDYSRYPDHPGRNPAHIPGGYVRHIEVPIDPKNPLAGTRRVYVRPRNPSRWLPHVGGARAGKRPPAPPQNVVETRQQRRHQARLAAKILQREENARVRAAHKRTRRAS